MRWAAILIAAMTLNAQDSTPAARLEHARVLNLERAAKLPDFVADEIAVRYKSPRMDPPEWRKEDTIESEIVVRGQGFERQHVMVNGKPWDKADLPNGVQWSVRFGYELKALFDPECHNVIELEGPAEAQGKPGFAYRFDAPPRGCFGSFNVKKGWFSPLKVASPGRTGRFVIDEANGNLLSFSVEAHDFPKGFELDSAQEAGAWGYVSLGGSAYLLPVGLEMVHHYTHDGAWRVAVEYKNHRHFESSSSVTFK